MQTARGASLNDAVREIVDDDRESARPRRIGVLVAVAAVILAIDATSKALAVSQLSAAGPIDLLGGVLKLRVLRNSGAAFNIGNGMTIVFTVIATGVVVAILRYARRLRSLPWAITLGLLLGGALGNLTDRIFRSPGAFRGHVVDWIELPNWPVFNLADSAIVCGGVLAVLLASRGLQVDGTVHREPQETPDVPSPVTRAPEEGTEPGDGEEGISPAGRPAAAGPGVEGGGRSERSDPLPPEGDPERPEADAAGGKAAPGAGGGSTPDAKP